MGERADRAAAYFKEGYNCAQAVVKAFADELDMEEELAIKIASPFGGGFARQREVCGTVSGMFIVMGALEGYADPQANEVKKALYAKMQELSEQFRARNGSIICGVLLGVKKPEPPVPDERTDIYYKKRPCVELVRDAAGIVETYLANRKS